MSIIKSTLNNNIVNIKCKHGELTSKLVNSLLIGSCKTKSLSNKSITLSRLLTRVACYTPFDSEPTFAYKLDFSKDTADSVIIDIMIGLISLPQYSGTGNAIDIVDHFYNAIENNVTSPEYRATKSNNILYIYSYDAASSFSTNVSIVVTDTQNSLTITETNLQNSLDEILDVWNCSTSQELCKLVDYCYKILDGKCNC